MDKISRRSFIHKTAVAAGQDGMERACGGDQTNAVRLRL